MKDTKIRSFVKSTGWEVTAFIAAIIFYWVWFGSFWESLFAGCIFTVIKISGLYFYERGWQKIKWGSKKS